MVFTNNGLFAQLTNQGAYDKIRGYFQAIMAVNIVSSMAIEWNYFVKE